MTKKMRACSWTLFCLVSVCVSASALMASLLSSSLRWQHSTPLPEARAGYAAGVLHGKLVIAGGTYWEGEKGNWTQKIFSARTHIFDPIGQSWKRLPDAPSPFGYAASTVVDNKLYVLGGYTGKDVNRKVFTLERKGTRYAWNVYGDMPEPRLFAWAVSVGSSIYLLGGTIRFEPYDAAGTCCTSQSATNSFMVLNTTRPAEGWRRLSPFPGAKRWGFSSETDGSFIWMFGGIYQAKPKDPRNEIRRGPPLQHCRRNLGKYAAAAGGYPRRNSFDTCFYPGSHHLGQLRQESLAIEFENIRVQPIGSFTRGSLRG